MKHTLAFAKKEDAPAELRDFLKENEKKDGFTLSLVPSDKLDEFRNKNITVSKELDETKQQLTGWISKLAKKADGSDANLEEVVAEFAELRTIAQQVKDGTLKGSGTIETEIATRTGKMKDDYEVKLNVMGADVAKWKKIAEDGDQQVKGMIVDRAVSQAAGDEKIGLNMQAMSDVLARARAEFQVQADGSVHPVKNGIVTRGGDGISPMTMTEWLEDLRGKYPYYFKNSNGGGAAGGDGTGGVAQYGGISQAEFNKLPPVEKLRLANAQGRK